MTGRLVVMALLLVGCRRLEVDQTQLLAALDKQSNAALETPEVRAAVDDLFSGLDSKVLAPAATQVGVAIGTDTRVAAALERLNGKLAVIAQTEAAVAKKQNPRATAEEIGALLEKRVSTLADGPAFTRMTNGALNRLIKRPEVVAEIDAFSKKVAHHPEVARLTASTLSEVDVDRLWRKRIVELNGGSLPDRARATELMSSEIWSTKRLSDWYAKIYRLPVLKREIERGLVRVLEVPSFRRYSTIAVVSVVENAQLQKGAIDFMSAAMSGTASEATLERSASAVLESPILTTALTTWLKEVLADPALAAIGDDLMKALVAAPEVRASMASLIAP